MSGADLRRGADLSDAYLSEADLRYVDRSDDPDEWDKQSSMLWNFQGLGADLGGADLSGARLEHADLRCTRHDENTRTTGATKECCAGVGLRRRLGFVIETCAETAALACGGAVTAALHCGERCAESHRTLRGEHLALSFAVGLVG
ncbi:pentapeptide repeat-containing protein [Actinosynnema sp. NPDC023794]